MKTFLKILAETVRKIISRSAKFPIFSIKKNAQSITLEHVKKLEDEI